MQANPSLNRILERAERRPLGTSRSPREFRASETSTAAESRLLTIVLIVAIYVAVISLAAFLWRRPLLLTAIYVPLSGFVLYRWRGVETLVCFLTGFLLGPAGEFVAVLGGAWSYAGHDRLPLWLPFAWGIAVVVMKQIVVLVGVWVPNHRLPNRGQLAASAVRRGPQGGRSRSSAAGSGPRD